MRLLVQRDANLLKRTSGKAEVDSDISPKLKRVHVVIPDSVRTLTKRLDSDDLLIANSDDSWVIDGHLHSELKVGRYPYLSGVWSGYRSVLVSNGNGGLFRLKGVSMDLENPHIQKFDNGEFEIFGAQPRTSAEFEKQMSDRFNRVLEKEGIVPIMKCKGYWNYPERKHYPKLIRGEKLSASVIEVQGDTRLDEFINLLENLFYSKAGQRLNQKGAKVMDKVVQLYYDMGYIVGRLKKLMDRNNQTWSSDSERSNAHVGNVVLYNGDENVKLGFVDFDASCDTEDFSLSGIRDLQRKEFETIMNSVFCPPISPRQIGGFLRPGAGKRFCMLAQFREYFKSGFSCGYEASGFFSRIENTIPFERFLEIFQALRSPESLAAIVSSGIGLGSNILSEEKYGLDKIISNDGGMPSYLSDLYGILGRNKNYQEEIGKGGGSYGLGYSTSLSLLNDYNGKKRKKEEDY